MDKCGSDSATTSRQPSLFTLPHVTCARLLCLSVVGVFSPSSEISHPWEEEEGGLIAFL